MAVYLLRVNWIWNELDIQGGDRIVWGYHVDAATAPPAADFRDAFVNSLTTHAGTTKMNARLPADLLLESFQVYDVVNGGPPISQVLPVTAEVNTAAQAGPSEVQVVVSRRVNDGLGRPFKKGRTYVGPLGSANTNTPRPSAGLLTTIGDFTLDWHASMVGEGWTPVVNTKGALNVPETIVDYVVDNAWDTQRRRGLEPTDETVLTPI